MRSCVMKPVLQTQLRFDAVGGARQLREDSTTSLWTTVPLDTRPSGHPSADIQPKQSPQNTYLKQLQQD